jgi:hypothetical protein
MGINFFNFIKKLYNKYSFHTEMTGRGKVEEGIESDAALHLKLYPNLQKE